MSSINLYNKDCMKAMKDMADNQYDLAIVDPPYGIGADITQQYNSVNKRISNGGKWKKYKKTNWDSSPPSVKYFNELLRVSKNQIIWGGNYFFNLNLSGVIIWNKYENLNMKDGELAKTSFNTFKIFNMSRADAYINKCDVKIHPTQKPVKLYEWLLMNYSKEGDKILDTHLGSGSIAIACHNLGYDLDAYEIDKEYYEATIKRFNNHTSQIRLYE